jgi:hypothetical protein
LTALPRQSPLFRHNTQNTTPPFGNVFAENILFSLDKSKAAWYNLRVVTGLCICTSPTIQRQQVPVKRKFPAEEIIETQAVGYRGLPV